MPQYGKIIVQKKNGNDGSHFLLHTVSCLIGREAECDIRVEHPSVSNKHCQLTASENGEVLLKNLSKGGTLLNGVPVTHPTLLSHMDVFTVAERSFRWEFTPTSLKNYFSNKSKTPTTASKARKQSSRLEKTPTPSRQLTEKSQKAGKNNKTFRTIATKIKKKTLKTGKSAVQKNIKPKSSNQRTKKETLSLGKPPVNIDESLDLANFVTPNISQDVFVSPLTNGKTPSAVKSSAKRTSLNKIHPASAKKSRLSFNESETPKSLSSTTQYSGSSKRLTRTKTSAADNSIADGISTPFQTPEAQTPNLRKRNSSIQVVKSNSVLRAAKAKKKLKEKHTSPDYTNVDGLKRVFQEGQEASDYTDVTGVKKLYQASTPEADYSEPSGLKRLFKKATPVDYSNPKGIKKLFSKSTPTADYENIRSLKTLMQGNSATPDYTRVAGIKRLLTKEKTPSSVGLSEVKRLFKAKTPVVGSPQTEVNKQLFKDESSLTEVASPKQKQSPKLNTSRKRKSDGHEKIEENSLNQISGSPSPKRRSLKNAVVVLEKTPPDNMKMSPMKKNTPNSNTPKSKSVSPSPVITTPSPKPARKTRGKAAIKSSEKQPTRVTRQRRVKTTSPKDASPAASPEEVKTTRTRNKRAANSKTKTTPVSSPVAVSPNSSEVDKEKKAPARRTRQKKENTPVSSPGTISPRKTRSARSTPQTATKLKEPAVNETPKRQGRRKVEKDANETPKRQGRRKIEKDAETKENKSDVPQNKRAKTKKESKANDKTPLPQESESQVEDSTKMFRPVLSPIVEIKTPKSRGRKATTAKSIATPTDRVLRRSKRI